MPGSPRALNLSDADQYQIREWLRAASTPPRVALRCRIVLAAAKGRSDLEIAAQMKVNRHTPALWRNRVAAEGPGSVWEIAVGRGRKPRYDRAKRTAIIDATLQTKPPGMTPWSCRLMAEAQGVSKNTVNRLWQLHNLKPHRSPTFKFSRDSKVLNKLTDVVGLYLNPPQKAVVLCVAEKSQIQVLDRTRQGLPFRKGRSGTITHDDERNATTTLLAVLSVLDGKVIGQSAPRHRRQEFLKFLRRLDNEFPERLALHLVLDNYGAHKTPQLQQWLARCPRFRCHFLPNASSWVDWLERSFGELTRKAARRGALVSVKDLLPAIEAFLVAWHAHPKPFVWTAKVADIIKNLERTRSRLESLPPGSTLPKRRLREEK